MLLQLEVKQGKDTSKYNVNIGKGNASIKWLALMASHRFCSERAGSIKPLVKNMFTTTKTFLHPEHVCKETLHNGEVVFVELYHELKVDEFCNPVYHSWTIIAFFTSQGKADLRTKLIEDKEQEAKKFYDERIRKAEEERVAENLPKLHRMKHIMEEQLSDGVVVHMQNEWKLIENSGALESIVPNEPEQQAIRLVIVANYSELSLFFKHYSAINSQGGTHTLEFIEFTKLVSDTKMLSKEENSSMILKFFGGDIATQMNQREFFISIINIALHKYTQFRTHKGRLAVSTAASVAPSVALHKLLEDHFKPHIHLLPSSIAIKKTLGSEQCLLVLHDYLSSLVRIFCRYAELSFDAEAAFDDSVNSGAMNVKQFSSFCSIFIGGIDKNENKITMKHTRQVFSASQHDEASNETEIRLKNENIDSHQELMVFPEFIEAVVRLGVLKYSNVDDRSEQAILETVRKALHRISTC